jgi:hypothetical protein
MVRRCAWGTCNADCRYPEKMIGIRFITFPNPKTKLEKCLRWIKACGRPHDQLNVDKIDKNKVICSKVSERINPQHNLNSTCFQYVVFCYL